MPDSPSQSSSVMPTQIGRYAILRKLGQGGMGAVYEAEHTKLQKRVALKVLPPEVSNDPASVARFEREMVAVGRVSHPGIIGALDADEADGVAYLAMELVDGQDVSEVIEFYEQKAGKPIPLSVACEIIRQAALAMQAAHEAGLVHRDLKPSNLMLGRDGNVKVLDLGLALLDAKHSDGGPLTSTGQVMGTVDYMAPEQAAETHTVDARADVYSLGATLYRLIAGKAPYPSDRFSSMLQKLMAVASTEPTPLQELRPKCPDKLVELVNLTMAKDPDKRLATANDLAERLAPAGDAEKLAQLAKQIPKRKPVERSAIEATGAMIPETEARVTADPTVDTDNHAEATFIGGASENAPTFAGPADGSQTIITPTSATQWKRKKKPPVPSWAWGVGVAVVALLMAVPFLMPGKPSPAAPDQNATATNDSSPDFPAVPATEYLTATDLDEITRDGIAFKQSDASIECGDINIDISKAFTLEMWCSPDPLPQLDERSSNVGLTLGPFEIKRYSDDNDLSNVWQCGIRKTGDGVQSSEASFESFFDKSATAEPVLQHVAAQWDGKAMHMFVDGRPLELSSTAFSGGVRNPDANRVARKLLSTLSDRELRIGSATSGYWGQSPETQFHGTIYQVRLSGNTRYTGPFTPTPLAADATTQGFYKLSKDSGATIADLSGNGHDGKIIGAKWVDVANPRPSGFALNFDGVDDFVDLPPLPVSGNTPFTLEAWFHPEVQSSDEGGLIRLIGPNGGGHLKVDRATENSCKLVAGAVDTSDISYGVMRSLQRRWMHVAVICDGLNFQVYADGKLLQRAHGNVKAKSDATLFTSGCMIGARPQGQELRDFFRGQIAGVRVSHGVRYERNFEVSPSLIDDDQTVALYKFNEGSGDILHDTSGNGHHGKIIGAEWVSTSKPGSDSALRFTDETVVEVPDVPMPENFTAEAFVKWAGPSPGTDRDQNVFDGHNRAWIAVRTPSGKRPRLAASTWNRRGAQSTIGDKPQAKELVSTTLRVGQDVHVALVKENTQLRLYQDGQLTDEIKLPEWWFDEPFEYDGLKLGERFSGEMSEFRYSSTVRYSDSFSRPSVLTTDADTVVLFDFHEGSGDTLNDSSGNGYDGKIVGAEWVKTKGPAHTATAGLDFDGVDDWVKIDSLRFDGSHPITLEAHITLHRRDGARGIVSGQNGTGIGLANMSDSVGIVVVNEKGKSRAQHDATIPLDQPIHCAGTWDGEQLQFFLDGKLISTADAPREQFKASPYRFALGAYPAGRDGFFDGIIHSARVSRVVRYTTEFVPDNEFENDDDTLALYHINEGSGDILKDSSGNGHDGKIIGAEWVNTDGTTVSNDGTSLLFDQPGSYVDVPSIPVDFKKPFCVESWFNPRDLAQTKNDIRVLATFGLCQLSIDKKGRLAQAVIVDVQKKEKPLVSRDISIRDQLENEELHIAMQWTGDDLLLFINGAPHSRNFQTWKHHENPIAFIKRVAAASTSQKLRIGNFMNEFTVTGSEDGHFSSSIDSFRVSQGLKYTSEFTPEKFSRDAQTLALYHFDEGSGDILHDSSGNGHDGKIVGAKWVRSGNSELRLQKTNAAEEMRLRFEPGNGVEIGSLIDETESLTMELWLEADEILSHIYLLGPHSRYFLGIENREYSFKDRFDPKVREVRLLDPDVWITPKKLTHLAFVRDAQEDELRLYVDGKLFDKFNEAGQPTDGKFQVCGTERQYSAQSGNGFRGVLDEIRISSSVRYKGERFTPQRKFEPDQETLALYHFDEGAGDVLHDSSGNGHHGKIIGAEWGQDDSASNTDRAAAEWVISEGGTVVTDAGEFDALDGLPKANFHVTAIQFSRENEAMVSGAMRRIAGLSKLRELSVGRTSVDDADLIHLQSLTNLERLGMGGSNARFTDAGLKHLETLTKINWLSLGDTSAGDPGLVHLQGLTKLEFLALSATRISDAGLIHLAPLKDLKSIHLQRNRLTGAGLVHLQKMESLQSIKIFATDLNDAGLKNLEAIKSLQELDIQRTNVTAAGVARLQKALPNCKISWDGKNDPNRPISEVDVPRPAVAPFDEAQAQAHQLAWAKHLDEPVVTTNSVDMQLAVIPPGKFTMGSPESEAKREPDETQVDVVLTKPFRVSVHEVTQGQWKAVTGTEPWKGQKEVQEGNHIPVTWVTWDETNAFCHQLTERERGTANLPDGWQYRLPTAAEWEWSCRAGTTTAFSFGDDESQLGEYAWYLENAKNADEVYAHAVGLKKPNPWGLHDVHGNVREWCSDWYDSVLSGGRDPQGPFEGTYRIFRSGSWDYTPWRCRSALRDRSTPSLRYSNLGFRVVLSQIAGVPSDRAGSSN